MTEQEGPSLASFFSQPADEEPELEASIAAFYAQPSEDDVPNTADTPEVDGFLAGLETYELADELSRRVGGKVVGLVVQSEGFERLIYGINP